MPPFDRFQAEPSESEIKLSMEALGHDPKHYVAGALDHEDRDDPRVRATTDATLLATHLNNCGVNYKAVAWVSAAKTVGVVSAVTGTTITIGGTAVTRSTITALEAGPN